MCSGRSMVWLSRARSSVVISKQPCAISQPPPAPYAVFAATVKRNPNTLLIGTRQPLTQAVARLCSGRPFFLSALFVLSGAALLACSLSGPPPAEYALGSLPAATTKTIPQTGFPIVEIKRVQLPDYLDTTDILERRGNQLVPSPTGRWGERL